MRNFFYLGCERDNDAKVNQFSSFLYRKCTLDVLSKCQKQSSLNVCGTISVPHTLIRFPASGVAEFWMGKDSRGQGMMFGCEMLDNSGTDGERRIAKRAL